VAGHIFQARPMWICTQSQPRTQALWSVYVIKRTWEGTLGRKTTKSIKLIHAAHAKATQAIEQHIAPGYEADSE
jgi:hypothetical protein